MLPWTLNSDARQADFVGAQGSRTVQPGKAAGVNGGQRLYLGHLSAPHGGVCVVGSTEDQEGLGQMPPGGSLNQPQVGVCLAAPREPAVVLDCHPPGIHICLEPQKGTIFGNRVSVDMTGQWR